MRPTTAPPKLRPTQYFVQKNLVSSKSPSLRLKTTESNCTTKEHLRIDTQSSSQLNVFFKRTYNTLSKQNSNKVLGKKRIIDAQASKPFIMTESLNDLKLDQTSIKCVQSTKMNKLLVQKQQPFHLLYLERIKSKPKPLESPTQINKFLNYQYLQVLGKSQNLLRNSSLTKKQNDSPSQFQLDNYQMNSVFNRSQQKSAQRSLRKQILSIDSCPLDIFVNPLIRSTIKTQHDKIEIS